MDNWTIKTPSAVLRFTRSPDFEARLERVPGIRQKKGLWYVPFNALRMIDDMQEAAGVQLVTASWNQPPDPTPVWDDIEVTLRLGGEVREWVYSFLTPYQKSAITFGWAKDGMHCWHSTGAGKSLTSYLLALAIPGPVVLVTRSAARLQHGREVERFLSINAHVIQPESNIRRWTTVNGKTWSEFFALTMAEQGRATEVARLWREAKATGVIGERQVETLAMYLRRCEDQGTRPFIIIGWEALQTNYQLLMQIRPGSVIYDELHWRGRNSKRWDVVYLPDLPDDPREAIEQEAKWTAEARLKDGFVKQTPDGWRMFLPVVNISGAAARLARVARKRIGTTATPVANLVRDLWSQLDIVEPNAWGNKSTWMLYYAAAKQGKFGFDTSGYSNLDQLKTRLDQVAHIVSYKETHKNLPAKRRQSVYLPADVQCKETKGFISELKEAKKRGPTAIIETRLAMAASRKRDAVLQMIGDHVQSGQKVVVFTGRRKDCDLLGDAVRKHVKSIGFGHTTVWSAHGSTSIEDRQAIVDAYMAHSGPCVLVGTGHSFGESLNLQDTDAAFFVMLPYTPYMLRQWEGRFSRLGQKRPVIIYYVIAEGTIDEHVASILIDKLPAVAKIVEDVELTEVSVVLAGTNLESEDEFVDAILACLDT